MSRTASSPAVLDASAVLALLVEEPGADEVEALLDGALMSTVNLAEVLQKSAQHGVGTEGLEFDLEALGLELRPFDARHARRSADLWERSPRAGLSLGDRACLALALEVGGTAVTTDRRWSALRLGVKVRVVR
jgi:PIN domain nuclease of toxin-antitoxin system